MALALQDLPLASRLFEQALGVAPALTDAWLQALPASQQHLVLALREMLAEGRAPQHPSFLQGGPRLTGADAAQMRFSAGDLIGPYRLLREIGRGGMASVWLAERPDGMPRRTVALKMPLLSLRSATHAQRFERERDVLALLSHPQIARLYDAGVAASGQPYIVLEPVDGQPITQACDERALDLPARLGLFLQVLAAVDHAHRHLVVHRDIKPSNVFVDAQGQVKLLDFGIAKLLAGDGRTAAATQLTHEGGAALTPRYAAPEQVDGRPVSTATDLYSLGVLLHELLVGQPPHADAQGSVAQALQALLHTPPVRPSAVLLNDAVARARGVGSVARLRVALAGDLDTIVLKALRKEPADRYASAERFADDIRRYLSNRPIAARAPSVARRLQLFARRHRAAVVAGAVGGVAALAMLGLLGQQHRLTLAQAARADAVREFMLDMVEDAEPDDTHAAAEVTGRQMVEGALRRAQERFESQPQVLGDVLSHLSRMLQRFGEDDKAQAVLAQAAALLEAHAPRDDPALNKTRVLTAGFAFDANDLLRAHALATAAREACSQPGAECAKARAYASGLLAQVALRQGQPLAALRHQRAAVLDTQRGFGERHAETAVVWGDLAVMARDAGELQEADRAVQQAMAIAAQTTLRVRDRLGLHRTQALLALELGRFVQAKALFTGLLARTTDREERALQWRLLANTELALGQAAAALAAADKALSLAEAGSADPEIWFARQARARALSLLGQGDAAAAGMRAVRQGLLEAGFAAGSAPVLRAQRVLGEVLARQGDLAAAWGEAESVVRALSASSGNTAIELGLAVQLQARIQRERGQADKAEALQEQARTMLGRQLPADHPFQMQPAAEQPQMQARVQTF